MNGASAYHCVDERNQNLAALLMDARERGGSTIRTTFSRNEIPTIQQDYKRECVELYGRTDWIKSSMDCWPRQSISATWLVNEILCYLEDLRMPPIHRWKTLAEIARYHALEADGTLVRNYGIGRPRFQLLRAQLASDPDSKRLVVSFWDRSYTTPAAETPCALSSQFLLRDDVLSSINTYRSHDFFAGVRTDAIRCAVAQQLLGCLTGVNGWSGPIAFAEGSIHYYPAKNPDLNVERIQRYFEPFGHVCDQRVTAFRTGGTMRSPWEVVDMATTAYAGDLSVYRDLNETDPWFGQLITQVYAENHYTTEGPHL